MTNRVGRPSKGPRPFVQTVRLTEDQARVVESYRGERMSFNDALAALLDKEAKRQARRKR